jgi:hypothetical protein
VGELRLPRSLDSIYRRPLRVVVATLDSLGAHDRASLTDNQCDEAIEWIRDYYDEGKPVYGSWLNALSRVVEG